MHFSGSERTEQRQHRQEMEVKHLWHPCIMYQPYNQQRCQMENEPEDQILDLVARWHTQFQQTQALPTSLPLHGRQVNILPTPNHVPWPEEPVAQCRLKWTPIITQRRRPQSLGDTDKSDVALRLDTAADIFDQKAAATQGQCAPLKTEVV